MELPSARVRFAPDFLDRLGALVVRWTGRRERREGVGRSSLSGAGTEFVGHRPYRPGEDLRQLDWTLYARLRKPFVRVARREASEDWAVLVDTSASMGVGRPGKLQQAAELATGIAAVGRKEGARVSLFLSGGGEPLRLGKRANVATWMRHFEERVEAAGTDGLAAFVSQGARWREAGAVFVIGDFLDLEETALHAWMRRGRELRCLQVLAEEELTPRTAAVCRVPVEERSSVRWVDAEGDGEHAVPLEPEVLQAYERLLGRRLERWKRTCARHRVGFGTWRSDVPFDAVLGTVFEE